MRGSIADGLAPAVEKHQVQSENLPTAKADNPPATEFVNMTGKSYNTIVASDFSYFEALNKIIQMEPIEALGRKCAGSSRRLVLSKASHSTRIERMKSLLTEAAMIGNATARAIMYTRARTAIISIRTATVPGSWALPTRRRRFRSRWRAWAWTPAYFLFRRNGCDARHGHHPSRSGFRLCPRLSWMPTRRHSMAPKPTSSICRPMFR